ncbi:MAG: hypothetical protein JYX80_02220 [Candidatus Scalindua sediminis]|nr:hypothetical protein [Candidatus Scalindua sediminis]
MSNYFTYISGIVAVLSFIMQIRDVFPAHREVRKAVLYISFGIFIGSLFGALNSINITIAKSYGLIQIALIIVLLIIVVVLSILSFIAIRINDKPKRQELWNALIVGIIVLVFIIIALGISTGDHNADSEFSINEIMIIAGENYKKKEYERAIKLYERVKYKYYENDPRRQSIDKKIKKIKQEMASEF